MAHAFWKQYVRNRKFEFTYTGLGAALGIGIFVGSFLIDRLVRGLAGLDASVAATFSATPVHALHLLAPVVLGWVCYSVGSSRRRLEETVRMAREIEAMARERACLDTVTGLFNRSYLLAMLEEGLATREWPRRNALLLLLDLDSFKMINDTYGHHVGDQVLVTIAQRIKAVCGENDIPVRLGGDEFVVVHFPPDGKHDEAGLLAGRLHDAIATEIVLRDARIIPVTSIGIARAGADGMTCSDVLKAADMALYEAKASNGGTFRMFDPGMQAERERLLRMEADLRAGIERGEFFLQYQPIYGTTTGAIRSFEALVRWRHPERGIVPPMEFVPLAESTGLIVKLGRWILDEACRTAASWPKPVGVSVNLSPMQFNDPDLVDCVSAALNRSGLAPGRLDLEITESLLLEATPRTHAVIRRLKEAGVRITIDDFGTGYSSLGTLKNFPFDRLKIDRSFTRDLTADTEDAEIVRAIVRLSRALRMETVLEGVETGEQLTFAQSEGLTEVQGFYYSKPLSQGDAAALFAVADAGEKARVA